MLFDLRVRSRARPHRDRSRDGPARRVVAVVPQIGGSGVRRRPVARTGRIASLPRPARRRVEVRTRSPTPGRDSTASDRGVDEVVPQHLPLDQPVAAMVAGSESDESVVRSPQHVQEPVVGGAVETRPVVFLDGRRAAAVTSRTSTARNPRSSSDCVRSSIGSPSTRLPGHRRGGRDPFDPGLDRPGRAVHAVRVGSAVVPPVARSRSRSWSG